MKRILITVVAIVISVVLLGTLILWYVLASWLPTGGKALLMRELERSAPIEVTIAALRYHPLHGMLLERVVVNERATHERWAAIPRMQVHVNWPLLVFRRQARFSGTIVLEHPCATTLSVSGRVAVKPRTAALDLRTDEIDLASLKAPLNQYVPSSLQAGRFRADLHLRQPTPASTIISGRLEGAAVQWVTPTGTLRGRITAEGALTSPSIDRGAWNIEAVVALQEAEVTRVPTIGAISRLHGAVRVTNALIAWEQLTGTALGAPWNSSGTITTQPPMRMETLLTSTVKIEEAAAALPQIFAPWTPTGLADVRLVCRAVFEPSAPVDCLARAALHQITVNGPKLPEPLTNVTGTLHLDALGRHLSIEELKGQLHHQPLAVSGDVELTTPTRLNLHVEGTLPLDAVRPWLPSSISLEQLRGLAELDVQLIGPVTRLQPSGRIGFQDATLITPSVSLEHAHGAALIAPHRVDLSNVSVRLHGEPVTINAVVSPLEPLTVAGTIAFSHGQLVLNGRMTPRTFAIDDSRLSLIATQIRVTGTIGRTAAAPSALDAIGTVELSELAEVPYAKLSALAAWQPRGLVNVEAQFRGQLSAWEAADLHTRLRAHTVSIRGIPLDEITVAVEQSGGLLRARIPSAYVAGGKYWGELTVAQRPTEHRYAVESDLVGLQLDRLAKAVPALQSRTIAGTASSHLLVTGTWEQRESWRGEGWLNATGDRLGDMPLLDALFRGLFGVLGERLGLDSLRRAEIKQAALHWRLADQRFRTEDLRLTGLAGAEPVAIYAAGSAGLDRTLDFVIEPEFSEQVILQAPTTGSLASTVLKAAGQLDRFRRLIGRHRLTGTLEDPKYRFEFSTQEIFKQLSPSGGALLEGLLGAFLNPSTQ
ncbi:MAG: DUF748 domain-containing protein [Candidatus Omnitrophica bacterium]|nr:DUF748 domain-containing protein [Candidatus Omnitrophota bacterium]